MDEEKPDCMTWSLLKQDTGFQKVYHQTNDSVNVLNLIKGERSNCGKFDRSFRTICYSLCGDSDVSGRGFAVLALPKLLKQTTLICSKSFDINGRRKCCRLPIIDAVIYKLWTK